MPNKYHEYDHEDGDSTIPTFESQNSLQPDNRTAYPKQNSRPDPQKLVLGPSTRSSQANNHPYTPPIEKTVMPTRSPSSAWDAGRDAQIPTRRPSYPQTEPGGYPPNSAQGSRHRGPRKRYNFRRLGCLTLLIIFIPLLILGLFTIPKVMSFGSAISTQSPLGSQTSYMGTFGSVGRTNLLIMGYGGGTHDGANLMDSLVVISLQPGSKHTSLVSIPRDLQVLSPNSQQATKINSIYALSSDNGSDKVAGANAAAQKVGLVTGLDVKYWLMIDFNGFRSLIDSIDGVDVYVPDSFVAQYPKNDDANVDASWIRVPFEKGMQHMDGETAIRYSRARYMYENDAESTDFARSVRQQIIIKAVIDKVKKIENWPKLFGAMDALQKALYTNLSLTDLGLFSTKMSIDDEKTARIGLSNQNVLVDSSSPDLGYVLLPKDDDWDAIVAYVKEHLYE